jgi:hypothetical protein
VPIVNTEEPSKGNMLVIDLDKELQLNKEREELRGKTSNLIEGSILINDNDEVSFKGKLLDKYSPITIKIGDNDEVSFSGDYYSIKTMQLKHGDIIEMKDKNSKIFLEMEVIE